MPEKPEVITVAKKLSLKLIGREITDVRVLWDNIIEGIPKEEFCSKLKGEKIFMEKNQLRNLIMIKRLYLLQQPMM